MTHIPFSNQFLDILPDSGKNLAIKLKTTKLISPPVQKHSKQNVISSLLDLDYANYFRCFISHTYQDVQMIYRLLKRLYIIPKWNSLWSNKLHLLIILKTICSHKNNKMGSKNFPKMNDQLNQIGRFDFFLIRHYWHDRRI